MTATTFRGPANSRLCGTGIAIASNNTITFVPDVQGYFQVEDSTGVTESVGIDVDATMVGAATITGLTSPTTLPAWADMTGPQWSIIFRVPLPIEADGSVHFCPDVAGTYTATSKEDSSTANVTVTAGEVKSVTLFVPPRITPATTRAATPQTLTHLFVPGVTLEVSVLDGQVTAARLVVTDTSNLQIRYAACDAGVIAAVGALVSASIAVVEVAADRGSALSLAWAAALENNAPVVPNVDSVVAALVLDGWSQK